MVDFFNTRNIPPITTIDDLNYVLTFTQQAFSFSCLCISARFDEVIQKKCSDIGSRSSLSVHFRVRKNNAGTWNATVQRRNTDFLGPPSARLALPQNSMLKCLLCLMALFSSFSSCYCYFAHFKTILSADIVLERLSEELMSSHWKLFLSPCHKVWAHSGMALWFISLTTSADSVQTPREIQALPSPVPGKVDCRSQSLKVEEVEEEEGEEESFFFYKTLGCTWIQSIGKCCFIIDFAKCHGQVRKLFDFQNNGEPYGRNRVINLLY